MSPLGLGHGLGFGGAAPGGAAWAPTDVSGCVLWLSADTAQLYQESTGSPPGTTPADTTGETVGAIRDRSTSGLHLTQGTAARRPPVDTDGLGSGVPAVAFDGSDDRLERTSTQVTVGSNAITLGIAYKLRATSGAGVYQTLASIYLSIGRCIVVHICNAGGYTTLSVSCNIGAGAAAGVGVAGVCNDTAEHTLVLTCDGVSPNNPTSWRIYLDGVSQTVTASGAHTYAPSEITLGAYNGAIFPASMNFGELVLYDSVLSAGDRSSLTSYLAAQL
jgi:hypothetical protein